MSFHLKAPIKLWQEVRALICDIHSLFGAPEAIATMHTLTATTHRELSRWVRCLEAFVRRLLLIEAAALLETLAPARKGTQRAKAREKRLVISDPDKPEEWRVSFGLLDRRRLAGGGGGRGKSHAGGDAGGPRFFSAWPLAERCEALLRVFNDPLRYARRLARKLRAKFAACLAMARRAVDVHGVLYQGVFDEAGHLARAALPVDTS